MAVSAGGPAWPGLCSLAPFPGQGGELVVGPPCPVDRPPQLEGAPSAARFVLCVPQRGDWFGAGRGRLREDRASHRLVLSFILTSLKPLQSVAGHGID